MSQAYTPGLEVSSQTTVQKLRELPLPGRALVKVGDTVTATTAVLSAELPGELDIVRVADRLGLDPEQVLPGMKVSNGAAVERGQVLCEIKSFFGMFTSTVKASAKGTVEFFTEANAHIGIRRDSVPMTIDAYIPGKVVAVEEAKSVTIETGGALVQGIFGVGGERLGEILCLECGRDQKIDENFISALKQPLKNRILIGGSNFTAGALRLCAVQEVCAVVTGSVDASTLREFVGEEISVSVTGDEEVPLTFIITEGFGTLPISERIVNLMRTLDGKQAAVNGATQVRAGAMRPEIIVPGPSAAAHTGHASSNFLQAGSKVRLIRVPYFGRFGTVKDLPHDVAKVGSGAMVRVARVALEGGEEVVVPRANLELA